MPIPTTILTKILQIVATLSRSAFKGTRLVKKVEYINAEGYLINIVRRGSLGIDGAVSQMVKFFKDGKLVEVWHVVTKAGKIIHRDIKQILK